MKPIVILEIANNHMGDICHGKKIVKSFDKITKKFKHQINFVVKYQYRDAKKFIHKNSDKNNKFVKRFNETFLSDNQWKNLHNFTKKYFQTACTPFDEDSAKKVFKQKYDFVKIASCSATDWPLVEKIYSLYKKNKKKILISLGGLNEKEISRVFSYFNNRNVDFNFLYCVAKYPSKPEDLNLSFFSKLKKIYGNCVQGLSLHETAESELTPIIAYGAGVRIFEKHVGIETKKYKVNDYSVTPHKLKNWLIALSEAIKLWGSDQKRDQNIKNEISQLDLLKRGVFLKRNIKKNSEIKFKNLYFSFPCAREQMKANNLSKNLKIFSNKDLTKDAPLNFSNIKIIDTYSKVLTIRDKIKNFLMNKGIILPTNPRLEISFHYGIDKFFKFGLTMINVINDKYCKKLLILLPGQKHPPQYHKIKKESFFILYGTVNIKINNKNLFLKSGSLLTINPNEVHEFYSSKGAVIEELSTTSDKSDSYYIDDKINENKSRKTFIYL